MAIDLYKRTTCAITSTLMHWQCIYIWRQYHVKFSLGSLPALCVAECLGSQLVSLCLQCFISPSDWGTWTLLCSSQLVTLSSWAQSALLLRLVILSSAATHMKTLNEAARDSHTVGSVLGNIPDVSRHVSRPPKVWFQPQNQHSDSALSVAALHLPSHSFSIPAWYWTQGCRGRLEALPVFIRKATLFM